MILLHYEKTDPVTRYLFLKVPKGVIPQESGVRSLRVLGNGTCKRVDDDHVQPL